MGSYAQITCTPNSNAMALAQLLAGNGVTVSNAVLTCPNGAAGTFTTNSCNLLMQQGLILTTGNVNTVAGPNISGSAGVDNNGAGDADLDGLTAATTHNACVLEFDMQILSDSIEFRYSFGSDEYNEYVCSGFNDIFAFFISGPGIAGSQNIALIPGTTIPVSINSVNNGSVGMYGTAGSCTSLAYSTYFIDNTSGTCLEYDGVTKVLTAKRKNLQPCATYHLKLAVADCTDGVFDSGVFLEANSLTSNAVDIDDATTNIPNVSNAMEGCVNGSVRFHLQTPVSYPTTVNFTVGGTATNGVDYTNIGNSITIPAGDTVTYLNIHPIADGLVEGNETVTIYLSNACSATPYDSAVLIIVDSLPSLIGPDTAICLGSQVQMTASLASTYAWSPSSSLNLANIYNPIATPTGTTMYYCTITIGQCVNVDSALITIIPAPFNVNAGPDLGSCTGSINISPTITGNPLPGNPFQYTWSPASGLSSTTTLNTTATPTGISTYVIKVQSGSCFDTDTVMVSIGNIQIDATATNQVCYGSNDATATVNVITGSTPYQFAWSNGQNTQNINGLSANTTYFVTVTDANGCTATDNATPAAATPIHFTQPTIANAKCFGNADGSISITANGGAGNFTYAWSNGGSGSTVSSLTANNYVVTATDQSGCTADTTMTISQPPVFVITATSTDETCAGFSDGTGTATAVNGSSPFQYAWSNGQLTQVATGLMGNSAYFVTVTDANGCTATDDVTPIAALPIYFNQPTIVDAKCFGSADGSITVTANGGTGNFTYTWNVGGSGSTATGLASNSYIVTAMDQTGCVADTTMSVGQPPLFVVNASSTNETCPGSADGTATVSAVNGNSPYQYNWSTGSNNQNVNGLTTGTYYVTVTDNTTCQAVDTVQVIAINPNPILFNPAVIQNVKCFGGSDGSITADAFGGNGTLTYSWATGGNTNTISGLAIGSYVLTVTDQAGCIADTSYLIIQPALLVATTTHTDIICNGQTNGTATAVVTGGTPAYTYVWSNGDNTVTATGLAVQTYTVNVTDANMCSASASASIAEPPALSVQLGSMPQMCPDIPNGTINAATINGTSPFNYVLTFNGNALQNNTSGLFDGLASGSYTVSSTDVNGCTATSTVVLNPPYPDEFLITADSASCFGSSNGAIHVTPISVVNQPYYYSVDNGGNQLTGDFMNLAGGNHVLIMTNKNGCVTDTFTIVEQPALGTIAITPGDTTMQLGESLQLGVSISPYTTADISGYSWGQIQGISCADCAAPIVTAYETDEYTVTVTYGKGCLATSSVKVVVEGHPPVFIPNAFTPNGDGNNDLFMVYGEAISKVELSIFNRWGEEIFRSTDRLAGWDGTYKGQMQNPTVYTYVAGITYLDGKQIQKKGTVTILR